MAILSAVALVVVRSDVVDAAGIDIAVVFERVTKKGNVAFVKIFTVGTVSAGTNIPGTKKGTISVDAFIDLLFLKKSFSITRNRIRISEKVLPGNRETGNTVFF